MTRKRAPEQTELIDRIRALLADERSVREVSMFGGRCFMVNDKMVVSAGKDGGLLVRVRADKHASLLSRPGATQAEMGTGRSMGPGWITVAPAAIADEDQLSYWLDIGLEHNRVITRPRQ